jgi:hypothetical protein
MKGIKLYKPNRKIEEAIKDLQSEITLSAGATDEELLRIFKEIVKKHDLIYAHGMGMTGFKDFNGEYDYYLVPFRDEKKGIFGIGLAEHHIEKDDIYERKVRLFTTEIVSVPAKLTYKHEYTDTINWESLKEKAHKYATIGVGTDIPSPERWESYHRFQQWLARSGLMKALVEMQYRYFKEHGKIATTTDELDEAFTKLSSGEQKWFKDKLRRVFGGHVPENAGEMLRFLATDGIWALDVIRRYPHEYYSWWDKEFREDYNFAYRTKVIADYIRKNMKYKNKDEDYARQILAISFVDGRSIERTSEVLHKTVWANYTAHTLQGNAHRGRNTYKEIPKARELLFDMLLTSRIAQEEFKDLYKGLVNTLKEKKLIPTDTHLSYHDILWRKTLKENWFYLVDYHLDKENERIHMLGYAVNPYTGKEVCPLYISAGWKIAQEKTVNGEKMPYTYLSVFTDPTIYSLHIVSFIKNDVLGNIAEHHNKMASRLYDEFVEYIAPKLNKTRALTVSRQLHWLSPFTHQSRGIATSEDGIPYEFGLAPMRLPYPADEVEEKGESYSYDYPIYPNDGKIKTKYALFTTYDTNPSTVEELASLTPEWEWEKAVLHDFARNETRIISKEELKNKKGRGR